MTSQNPVLAPFKGVDWWHTLALVGYLVAMLAIGVILGMEFIAVAAYQPSPHVALDVQSRPAWVGMMEAIRTWMLLTTCAGIGTGLAIDYLGLEEDGNPA